MVQMNASSETLSRTYEYRSCEKIFLFFLQGIGCTKISKAKNEGSLNGNSESRSYLEKKLVFCFGSYISSQLLLPFGEENFLCSSELKQAQEVSIHKLIVSTDFIIPSE
jgi:hypothetical protein